MPDESRTSRKQSLQVLGSLASGMVMFNIVFYLLSAAYYEDKVAQAKKAIVPGMDVAIELAKLDASLESVRLAFLILTVLVAALSYAATWAPRQVGHGLAVVTAFASGYGGAEALVGSMPEVLGVTMIVVGATLLLLVYYSRMGSRPAWSFLVGTLVVLAIVTFFGAPKIRNVLDIGLWHALIIPALQVVAVIALTMVRADYHTATPTAAKALGAT